MPRVLWREPEPLPEETSPRLAGRGEEARLPAGDVLSLQRSAGNAAVARALAATLARSADPARDAFVARGVMPSPDGLDFQSATGKGGFNVVYDPQTQELSVELRVGFEFKHGLAMQGGAAVPVTRAFNGDAADVNANFPVLADRRTEVRTNWRWSPGEGTQWAQEYATMVQDVWGSEHYFVSDLWDDLYAAVNVSVDVHEHHLPDDHCKATVFKVPAGSTSGPGAQVKSAAGPTGAKARLTSATLGTTFEYLNYPIEFPEGSADLYQSISASKEVPGDPGDVLIDKLVVDLQPATPGGGAPITVTGHASTSGREGQNRDLSLRRAEAVAAHMRSTGAGIDPARITVLAEGEQGAGPEASWQRVDIRIGGGEEQITAAHETGHLFGLGDEYSSPVGGTEPGAGSPGPIGDPADHGALPPMGGGVPPAVHENTDSVMSVGNVVRAQHYITFLEALNAITAPVHFSYGGVGTPPAFSPQSPEEEVVGAPVSTP